jgi:hypothetical protein
VLVVMSMHIAVGPQIIWLGPQAQVPPLQVAPGGQGVQPPQCTAVPPLGDTQAPSVHWISPVGQTPQAPFAQAWSAPHTMLQVPQCAAFDATHCPPQERRPPLQMHWPLAQVSPTAQALPHWPQLRGSVDTSPQITPEPPVPDGTPPTLPVQPSAARASPAATPAT